MSCGCKCCRCQNLINQITSQVLSQVTSELRKTMIQAYAIGNHWYVGDLVGFDNTYWVYIKENIGEANNMPIGVDRDEYWKNLSILAN